MTTPRHPKLLDIVAVTSSNPDELIEVGDVVTVVEIVPPPDGLEFEFHDLDGRTHCVATLHVDNLMVLNRERTGSHDHEPAWKLAFAMGAAMNPPDKGNLDQDEELRRLWAKVNRLTSNREILTKTRYPRKIDLARTD